VLDSLEEQVHGLDPLTPQPVEGAEFLRGDAGDPDVLARALREVDEVVHLAALVGVGQSMYEIARYVRHNSDATARFLDFVVSRSPSIERLVVASSMSIYGEGEYVCADHGVAAPMPRAEEQLLARDWECHCPTCGAVLVPRGTREEKPLIPTSVYAVTKRDHEELCLIVGRAYGIPTVALRFFNVYGPGQALSNPYTGVAAIFAARLLNGRPPVIFEDGAQARDFIHVDDIVDGIVSALGSDDAVGHAINLGTGDPTTVNDVANALAVGLGLEVEPERPGSYRAGDIRHCFADVEKSERLLGFRAKTEFRSGIKALVEWIADQEVVDRVDEAKAELVARGLAR